MISSDSHATEKIYEFVRNIQQRRQKECAYVRINLRPPDHDFYFTDA